MTTHAAIAELRRARRSRALVRVQRRFDPYALEGFVVGLGEWLLLNLLEPDTFTLNGWTAVRARDVRSVLLLSTQHGGFAVHALRLRGARSRIRAGVKLSGTADLLSSAARQSPVITIHQEAKDDSVCWIGRPVAFASGFVEMREIATDASWLESTSRYRLSSITRVDFGGGHETALMEVAAWREGNAHGARRGAVKCVEPGVATRLRRATEKRRSANPLGGGAPVI